MDTKEFLEDLGKAMAETMDSLDVPTLLSGNWRLTFDAMVTDTINDGEPVRVLVVRLVQALTLAKELSRIYGRG
jgi:hypothetical protein